MKPIIVIDRNAFGDPAMSEEERTEEAHRRVQQLHDEGYLVLPVAAGSRVQLLMPPMLEVNPPNHDRVVSLDRIIVVDTDAISDDDKQELENRGYSVIRARAGRRVHRLG